MTLVQEDRPPALADGVQLIGEYEGSGYKEPPSLVRRADGQVIQLPPLLYAVASHADGEHGYADIAAVVSDEIRRGLDPEQVRFLVDEKLRPLGILAAADGSTPDVAKADPFLALKLRMNVIPERVSNVLGAAFQPLFLPLVVVAVLVAFVAADVWLFAVHGVAQSIRQSIYHPSLFLALFAAVVLAAGFHEIGHAAACRYGGGRPGKMGCGLYLAWPAFYTDVTDAYRLGKRARLRTDLGGVYFNVVIVLVTVGAYLVTGFEPLLLLVVVQHFEIVHQLLPVIRLDGYYIVADLTGVPDLFARIGPILHSMVPWRRAGDEVRVLKRWVRVAVTAWVLVVVPLLVFELLMVLIHLPRIVGTGWASGTKLWHAASAGFGNGDPLGALSSVLQVVVLAIPIVGIALMLVKVGRSGTGWMWRSTAGRPVSRALAVAAMGAGAAALLSAWLPRHNYAPIQPGERGTLAEGISAVRELPSGSGPLHSRRVAEQRTSPSSPSSPPVAPDRAGTSTATSTSTTVEPGGRSGGSGAGSSTATTSPNTPTSAPGGGSGSGSATSTPAASTPTSTSSTSTSTTTSTTTPSSTTTTAP
jgi:putative peptide zinc metalloprotease protein